MSRHHARRGQSMVEFALILPLFVLLLVGVFDFGRAVYAYNTINNAAREGGRFAIVDQSIPDIQAHAASHAVSLGIPVTDVEVEFRLIATPNVPNSCVGAVPGADNNTVAIVDCIAIITVPYDYTAVTPIIGNIVGTIVMEGESRFKVDFDCEGAECPLGD